MVNFFSMLFSFLKKIRLSYVLAGLCIWGVLYYFTYKCLYCAFYIDPSISFFINPQHDFRSFGWEQLWSYRCGFARNCIYPRIHKCFYNTEEYDLSFAGIYWFEPLYTFGRFLLEAYWIYPFHGHQTIWSYTGEFTFMHWLNPVFRISSYIAFIVPEVYFKWFGWLSHYPDPMPYYLYQLYADEPISKFLRYMYTFSRPGYLVEEAAERASGQTSYLFYFLSVFTNNYVIGFYIFFHHLFAYIAFLVNCLIFVVYIVWFNILVALSWSGLGIFLGFLVYKTFDILFFFFWMCDLILDWDAFAQKWFPLLIKGGYVGCCFIGIVVVVGWLIVFIPIAYIDYYIYFSSAVYRSFRIIKVNAKGRYYSEFVYKMLKPFELFLIKAIWHWDHREVYWHDVSGWVKWGRREIRRGSPIIGLVEDVRFRSERNHRKIVTWGVLLVVTYYLCTYYLYFIYYGRGLAEYFDYVFSEQCYGYPQRFMMDTYWLRLPSWDFIGLTPWESYEVEIGPTWGVWNTDLMHDYTNWGEYNPDDIEKDFFYKGHSDETHMSYEFIRFIFYPTFCCVFPNIIMILMSRTIRRIAWPYYDTLSVIYWSFFFFYIFGTYTIGYSFFLRWIFNDIFLTLHEGELYGDKINIDLTETRRFLRENVVCHYWNSLDAVWHYIYWHETTNDPYFKHMIPRDLRIHGGDGFIPIQFKRYESAWGTAFKDDPMWDPDLGAAMFTTEVEFLRRQFLFTQWQRHRVFNDYNSQGFNRFVEIESTEDPDNLQLLPLYVANAYERTLIQGRHTRGGMLKGYSFAEIIDRQRKLVRYYGDKYKKTGFPKTFWWSYHKKRNAILQSLNAGLLLRRCDYSSHVYTQERLKYMFSGEVDPERVTNKLRSRYSIVYERWRKSLITGNVIFDFLMQEKLFPTATWLERFMYFSKLLPAEYQYPESDAAFHYLGGLDGIRKDHAQMVVAGVGCGLYVLSYFFG